MFSKFGLYVINGFSIRCRKGFLLIHLLFLLPFFFTPEIQARMFIFKPDVSLENERPCQGYKAPGEQSNPVVTTTDCAMLISDRLQAGLTTFLFDHQNINVGEVLESSDTDIANGFLRASIQHNVQNVEALHYEQDDIPKASYLRNERTMNSGSHSQYIETPVSLNRNEYPDGEYDYSVDSATLPPGAIIKIHGIPFCTVSGADGRCVVPEAGKQSYTKRSNGDASEYVWPLGCNPINIACDNFELEYCNGSRHDYIYGRGSCYLGNVTCSTLVQQYWPYYGQNRTYLVIESVTCGNCESEVHAYVSNPYSFLPFGRYNMPKKGAWLRCANHTVPEGCARIIDVTENDDCVTGSANTPETTAALIFSLAMMTLTLSR